MCVKIITGQAMTLRIVKTWVPSAGEWDDAWRDCPYSTYFHSREWAEIWADYSHGKISPAPLGVALSDGTQIVLSFSKEKIFKGLITRYISSPAGTFGGWLSRTSLDQRQQELLMTLITNRFPDLMWRFNPYEKVLHAGGLGCLTEGETNALDLSTGFEEIYRGWTKGHTSAARKARKARKAGVKISIAETPEDWQSYYRVYEESLNRWGENTTSSYSWHLFESILQRSSPNIRLWLAKYEGLVVAGALCFYSSAHVVYWHGVALSSYFELRPVNLLMYEAIKDAAERGLNWFDFNPSGGLEGVKAFKLSFGAAPLESNVLTLISLKQKLISSIYDKVNAGRKGA
jgi:lipid II:glycine glycyltransferase (peptidoglycan interpeptide bridge formation enzyme)